MKFIYSYVKEMIGRVSLVLFVKMIGTVVELVIPLLLAYIINDLIELNNVWLVCLYGGYMVLASLGAVIFNVMANRMAAYVAKETTKKIRRDLFNKITTLEEAHIDFFSIPSLVSRMTTDTYNVNNFIGMIQRMGVRAPILLVGGTVMTLLLDPILTLVMLSLIPIIFVLLLTVVKLGIPLYINLTAAVDRLLLVVRENVVGSKVVKALDKKEYEVNKFSTANNNCIKTEMKASLTMAVLNPCLNLIMNIGLVLIIYVGATRVYNGTTENGNIVAIVSYFTIILNSLLSITRIFINGSKSSASANRIKTVMDKENTLVPQEKKMCDEYIKFEHVNFSYNKIKNNLEDISFTLEKGQSLGIIGATGSGKSSIINLIMRFYDADSGEIYVNHQNIKSLSKEELTKSFGVVFQTDVVFSESIIDNITFGRNLSYEKVEEAAMHANAHDFIMQKDGYSTQLSRKGGNLSGGQKQRLLLARAMADNPDILVLDDSSSALDYKTDQQIRETIASSYGDKTSIIIASRISSIQHCDKIIVLENGKIDSIGKHDELMQTNELYKKIKESQMGGDPE